MLTSLSCHPLRGAEPEGAGRLAGWIISRGSRCSLSCRLLNTETRSALSSTTSKANGPTTRSTKFIGAGLAAQSEASLVRGSCSLHHPWTSKARGSLVRRLRWRRLSSSSTKTGTSSETERHFLIACSRCIIPWLCTGAPVNLSLEDRAVALSLLGSLRAFHRALSWTILCTSCSCSLSPEMVLI